MNELQQAYDSSAYSGAMKLAQLKEVKHKFMSKLEYKTRGAILRCKMRYAEYGEKNSSYFLNIEKRNSNKKSLNIIKNKSGRIVKDRN